MKPKKKTTKYVVIAIIILIIAAFGLIDFRGLFRSEPKTAPVQPKVQIKKPETFVSQQKFDQTKGEEDQEVDNASVPDAGPTDATDPLKIPAETGKPLNQDDLALQNSAIKPLTEEQKPAIVETDITAKDDKSLAKAVDSAPSKATDDTLGKPIAPNAGLKTDKPAASPAPLPAQSTAIVIMQEGPGPYPYSIQLASFNEDNHAAFKEALQKYQKKGLTPFWVKVDLGNKGFWHRVLVGCFRQKSDAREVIRDNNLEGAIVADTKFAIRIGEYKDETTPRQMLTALEAKGYFPYVIKKNAEQYVLYVGAFYSRKVAQKTVDELAVQGVPSETVLR